ncbi:MAG: GNAT family protein [Longimicrobiales bacterium]
MAQPIILEGRHVRLEPLSIDHLDELCEFALDPELWRWTVNLADTNEKLLEYIEEAVNSHAAGNTLPFLIRERTSGRAVGSTRFGNIEPAHRRLEIGWTWVDPAWQRSAINTETKYLLLSHAFETLGCIRVEFKTDALNTKSRNALMRLGAVEEGILRSHFVTVSGRLRDTIYYSILLPEWPAVKASLKARLA